MTLLVCGTCPRYDPRRTGEFGNRVVPALSAMATGGGDDAPPVVDVRIVRCLGGCPDHGVAAVDGPRKTRVRFTGLDAGDDHEIAALMTAAQAHQTSESGSTHEWQMPAALVNRVSAVTEKRPATVAPIATYRPQAQRSPRKWTYPRL